MKKIIAAATLIALVNLLTGCASTGGTGDLFNSSGAPHVDVQAEDFPELRFVTTGGESFRGKLTRVEGDIVTLKPFPYWNIPDVRIPLDDIHQIELTGSKSHTDTGFLAGFSVLFIPVGAIGAAKSKYDVDFSNWLLGSAIVGAVGGLLGLVIAAVSDTGKTSKFKFYAMSAPEKIAALLKIMGRAGSRP